MASTQVTPEPGEVSVQRGVLGVHVGDVTLLLLKQSALAPPPPPPAPLTTGVPFTGSELEMYVPWGWKPLLPPFPKPRPPRLPNPPQPATTVSCWSAVRVALKVSSDPLPPVPKLPAPAVCQPVAPDPPPTVRVYAPVFGTEMVWLFGVGGPHGVDAGDLKSQAPDSSAGVYTVQLTHP
jgi:hypothetical protein